MINLPKNFEDRMKSFPGFDFEQYKDSLSLPPVKGFRVNTGKISVVKFSEINVFGKEKIPFVSNGYYLDYEKAGNHPFHHAGMIYIQEPAAMAPVECIDIQPDWTVLDMCAAPGGKSTQIANKLGENGVLVSNEVIPSRCKILTGNIERIGAKNTVTTCLDVEKLAKLFPKTFDLIVCDAPCSGEGMFRKEAAAVSEWSKENVEMCAKRQKKLLSLAANMLKDGGYILYSTCTFSLEENEMTVNDFLSEHPEFSLAKVHDNVKNFTADGICFDGCNAKNIEFTRRFYPYLSKGEGQFMALLHSHRDNTDYPEKRKEKNTEINKTVTEFLDSVLTDYSNESVKMYNGNPIYFSSNLNIKDGTAFSCGITIGEIKKNYILPHHQFFMAMGTQFKRIIELDNSDIRLNAFLRGEEIPVNCGNGWAAVTVNGCTLGGVKVVNGIAKNHYPKGLRIK